VTGPWRFDGYPFFCLEGSAGWLFEVGMHAVDWRTIDWWMWLRISWSDGGMAARSLVEECAVLIFLFHNARQLYTELI